MLPATAFSKFILAFIIVRDILLNTDELIEVGYLFDNEIKCSRSVWLPRGQ